MSRYIDAHKLAKIYMGKGKDKLRLATVINELELVPTADVVEVVRCKDCYKHKNGGVGCPFYDGIHRDDDDYCSYGAR